MLLQCLYNKGICGRTWRIIKSWYTSAMAAIEIENTVSELFSKREGYNKDLCCHQLYSSLWWMKCSKKCMLMEQVFQLQDFTLGLDFSHPRHHGHCRYQCSHHCHNSHVLHYIGLLTYVEHLIICKFLPIQSPEHICTAVKNIEVWGLAFRLSKVVPNLLFSSHSA